MTERHDRIEELLGRYLEQRLSGEPTSAEALCPDEPELLEALQEAIEQFERLDRQLGDTLDLGPDRPAPTPNAMLPQFDGFRTIERLGGGG